MTRAATTVEPIRWTAGGVRMLDQRRLPAEVIHHTYTDYRDVAQAIREMVIRGAPAIGVAAAMGVALGVERSEAASVDALGTELQTIIETMGQTRPTAVDLFWALARMRRRFEELAAETKASPEAERLAGIRRGMAAEAQAIHGERKEADLAIGRLGAELLPSSGRVMTQCNAGALATGGIGTALGIIRVAVAEGRRLEVWVPETRPYLQGARLTAWELQQEGIPQVLITDNMVGHFLKTGGIGAVVVGADRIAANGDTANKIGTYTIAVLAREHRVPFYVAAPLSTVDLTLDSGEQIPIEERPAAEVTRIGGTAIAPPVPVAHPAFDVTPARLIDAIITERGIARAPYEASLRRLAAPSRLAHS
ncbi:MAG TPA: S-methyl-5-thioribose-1-phosphate isomerase [Candidatus Acidoferrales bacterium]|nr:S-methyl-5-thioribose-1-phosphate isomerase [Candidatus Acidoferrales bacterium]